MRIRRRPFVSNFLRYKWSKNEPRALGCEAFVWVGRNQLDEYKFPEADGRLLMRLHISAEYWQ